MTSKLLRGLLLLLVVFTYVACEYGDEGDKDDKDGTVSISSDLFNGAWTNEGDEHLYLLAVVDGHFLWLHEGDPLFEGWSDGYESGEYSIDNGKFVADLIVDDQPAGGFDTITSVSLTLDKDTLSVTLENDQGEKVSTQLTRVQTEDARVGLWLDESGTQTTVLVLSPTHYALFSEEGDDHGLTTGSYTLNGSTLTTQSLSSYGTPDFTFSGSDSALFQDAAFIITVNGVAHTLYKVYALNGGIQVDGLTYDWAEEPAYFQGIVGTTVQGIGTLTPATDILDVYTKVHDETFYLRWDLVGNFTFPHSTQICSDYNIFLRISNDQSCQAEGELVHIRTHTCDDENVSYNDFRMGTEEFEQVIRGGLLEIAIPLSVLPNGTYMTIDTKATSADDEAGVQTYYDLIDDPRCIKIR